MLKKRFIRPFFLTALAILLPSLLLFFCFRKFDFHLFWVEIEQIRWSFFIPAFLSTLCILLALSLQWKLFLPHDRSVSLGRMFQVVSVFAMLVNTVPFWGGHAFAIYLLGHREKVGKTAALSVITLEQIAEGFGKIMIFGVVALACPFPLWMRDGMETVLFLVFAAYLTLFFLAYRFRNLKEKRENSKSFGWIKIFSVFETWAYHLHVMRSFKKMAGGIALAMAMKGFEALGIFLVQKSFGVELPLYSSFLVLAALGLATMLPLAPGRLGVFEATAYVIYQYLGVDPTRALTLGIFIHLVHTLPFILTGYIISLKMGLKKKEMSLENEMSLALAQSES
jgi:uncharacterized protein (TIRG00374 family)